MDTLKFLIFVEIIAIVVFFGVYLVTIIIGEKVPFIVLPILMGIVFIVVIFTIYVVAPFAERFL